MNKEIKPTIGFRMEKNDKGETILIPVYLKETPKEEIDRLNKEYSEWKTTKQVKYDNDGNRV